MRKSLKIILLTSLFVGGFFFSCTSQGPLYYALLEEGNGANGIGGGSTGGGNGFSIGSSCTSYWEGPIRVLPESLYFTQGGADGPSAIKDPNGNYYLFFHNKVSSNSRQVFVAIDQEYTFSSPSISPLLLSNGTALNDNNTCDYKPMVFYKESGWGEISPSCSNSPFLLYLIYDGDATCSFNGANRVFKIFCSSNATHWDYITSFDPDQINTTACSGYTPVDSTSYYHIGIYFDGGVFHSLMDTGTTAYDFVYATSSDGINWTCQKYNFLSNLPTNGWDDSDNQDHPVILNFNGTYYIFYSTGPTTNSEVIAAISTKDFNTFNFYENVNPIHSQFQTPAAWATDEVSKPSPIVDGDTIRIYFSAGTEIGVISMCLSDFLELFPPN